MNWKPASASLLFGKCFSLGDDKTVMKIEEIKKRRQFDSHFFVWLINGEQNLNLKQKGMYFFISPKTLLKVLLCAQLCAWFWCRLYFVVANMFLLCESRDVGVGWGSCPGCQSVFVSTWDHSRSQHARLSSIHNWYLKHLQQGISCHDNKLYLERKWRGKR